MSTKRSDFSTNSKTLKKFLSGALSFVRGWLFNFGLLLATTVALAFVAASSLNSGTKHLVITILVILFLHTLHSLILYKDVDQMTRRVIDAINSEIGRHVPTTGLFARAGIDHLYASRKEAMDDMKRDLLSDENTTIRIIGISLNDFLDDDGGDLYRAFDDLTNETKQLGRRQKLDIQLLLIDPKSHGATLRSASEQRDPSVQENRLDTDLDHGLKRIERIKNRLERHLDRVSVECHLYRTPPILFLLMTDSVCYVHQYYFWGRRNPNVPIPVLRYEAGPVVEPERATSMYLGLKSHFEWLWDEASEDYKAEKEEFCEGTDFGVHTSGLVNVYVDSRTAAQRMSHVVRSAKREIWLQGISLKSFLSDDTNDLHDALAERIHDESIPIRILLIDNECEQARIRALREALLKDPGIDADSYLRECTEHRKSKLYVNTELAIQNLRSTHQELVRENAKGSGSGRRTKDNEAAHKDEEALLQLRKYQSAPSCFLLLADDRVFVEQYMYGRLRRDVKAVLGGDIPLLEFQDHISWMYSKEHHGGRHSMVDSNKNPFRLFKDHLQFVWKQGTEVDLRD